MNEANLFTMWLYQDRPSKISRKDLESLSLGDVKDLPVNDLIAVLYYGRDSYALLALKALRQHFEDEMHHLEQLTYPQGAEE